MEARPKRSRSADWRNRGSNSGPLDRRRVDYISTTTQRVYMVMDLNVLDLHLIVEYRLSPFRG